MQPAERNTLVSGQPGTLCGLCGKCIPAEHSDGRFMIEGYRSEGALFQILCEGECGVRPPAIAFAFSIGQPR